jgi:hypothetical protein
VHSWKCNFENDESFERIIEGCSRVERLYVDCEYNSQFTAVASLLQDPANELRDLSLNLVFGHLDNEGGRSFSEQAVREISASLVGNMHLKSIFIGDHFNLRGHRLGSIDKLLCDVSSIENIKSNSNHTLESISIPGYNLLTLAEQCLELNKHWDKAKVIRNKILRFYFLEEFHVSPFVNMHLYFLPKVMNQIRGNDKQSAQYRLLKCIPDVAIFLME